MISVKRKIDRPLLIIVTFLIVVGFFVFTSAALGLMNKTGASFFNTVTSQSIALLIGLFLMLLFSFVHYSHWKKIALYIFLLGLVSSLLVFVPGIGFGHGGAIRWIDLGFTTIQPAEILKFGFVLYCASWLTNVQGKTDKFMYGLLPLLILVSLAGIILLLQKDTDSFIIITGVGVAMFIAAGARWRDVFILGSFGVLVLGGLIALRPYIYDRILTFINPSLDILGSSFQIKQSLISIGSGEMWGRGFGQSIQKFTFLPEPIGDSIFSVAAEEFGFVGSVVIIFLFVALLFRGLLIASRSSDFFARLVTVGVVILIVGQSFRNIGGMIGVLPLSGTTLLFFSQGGSALLMVLALTGIIFNISRYQKKK